MSPIARDVSSPQESQEERPTKRAKLLSKVCEACKHRKAKCDNAQPKCGHCCRKDLPCVYREKGQPGLRPGFGRALEQRMETLEEDVARIARCVDMLVDSRTDNAKAGTDDEHVTIGEEDPENGRDPVDLCRQPSRKPGLWQTPPPAPQAAPQQQGLPLNDAIPNGDRGPYLALEATESPSGLSKGLPSRSELLNLVDVYFELIQPWCPLFLDQQQFKSRMFSKSREILLHGIVVAAARFWTTGLDAQREQCVRRSRDQILLHSVDRCTLEATQALALLAVDSLGGGTGPRCWNTMCILVTAARHMGIATNPLLALTDSTASMVRNDDEESSQDDFAAQVEERRRLFWVICSLDRLSSVAHGQPGGVDTRSIRMPYLSVNSQTGPAAEVQLFDGKSRWHANRARETPDTWHHFVDLLAFADRCNQLLIQPVNLTIPARAQEWQEKLRSMESDLSSWFDTLPPQIAQKSTALEVPAVLLFANYHLVRIRIYTVAAFPSTTALHVRASTSARARCREAIAEVASLARRLLEAQFRLCQLGPQFAFVLWVASRSLLILCTTGFEADTTASVEGDLDPLIDALQQLAVHWPAAARYKDLVQFIKDTKDGPDGAAGLKVFNDTRRTAHGIEAALGELSREHSSALFPSSLDFLDLPFLDNEVSGDPTLPWMSSFGLGADDEWLV